MPEQFGSPAWCLWCKTGAMTAPRQMQWVQKPGTEGEMVWVCSEPCQREVEAAMVLVQRGLPVFMVALVVQLGVVAIGVVLTVLVDVRMSCIVGLAMAAFGMVFVKYPLVTSQTVQLFGLKKGFAVGRITGLVMALTGLAIASTAFLLPAGA